MSVNQRIIILYESLNIQKKEFANQIGIAQTTLHNFLNHISEPNSKILVAILEKFPDLSAEWLLRGIEPMFNTKNRISIPDSVNEPSAVYNTEGVGELKIDIVETERQLYERIIKAKDETIEILKNELKNKT